MAIDKLSSQALATGSVTSDAIATGAITVADIPDGEITAVKLKSTAISDKLGYTPVSPTDLTNSLAPKADTTAVNTALALKAPLASPTFTGDVVINSTTSLKLPAGTTAQRPSSPIAGMSRFNTTDGLFEVYNGTTWQQMKPTFVATGGTVTTVGGYNIHTFTTSGTFTVVTGSAQVELLVVAGGGGTGFDVGGGGGAGGLIYYSAYGVSSGSYAVTVGLGGGSGQTSSVAGSNGSNSTFGSLTAIGGGGGGTYPSGQTAGLSGGSGGGGGNQSAAGGSGTSGQGYAGGASSSAQWGSGAGGGAGGAGSNGTAGVAVPGGPGVVYNITGSSARYAGGGYGNLDGGTIYQTGYDSSGTYLGYYGYGANGTGSPNNSPYSGNPGIVIVRYLV